MGLSNFFEFRTHKVIYRQYAGLFFSLCVDIHDNELAHLEAIHLLVEVLDHFFSGVCELDLVFGFNKVYMIIDEFFMPARCRRPPSASSSSGSRSSCARSERQHCTYRPCKEALYAK